LGVLGFRSCSRHDRGIAAWTLFAGVTTFFRLF
jgi:hypothetical protein